MALTGRAKDQVNPATDALLTPESLAPKYVPERHALYVNALCHVLADEPSIRNIAVTGAYGTGKSSVLGEVARRHEKRVVRLSLSSVGTSPVSSGERDKLGAASVTNRIQKEVVKQLLYQEHPRRTPASTFHRAAKPHPGREVSAIGLWTLLIVAILLVTGIIRRLATVLGTGKWQAGLAFAAAFLLVVATAWLLRRLTNGRLGITEVKAGPATVTLAAASDSYFDKYLDEIVYHFEITGRDVVIFEDIDRFNDVHIFETLRTLNTILNGAGQLSGRSVRFIYALRDSVFEKLGTVGVEGQDAADTEMQRANRTKFFDLVIPIVPFITHQNARDLMSEAMGTTPNEVSRNLIDLAGRNLAEMRLIINIRNEFEVFRRKLRNGEHQVPGLDDDHLFAMVVYKNVHMSEFERIPLGTSDLHTLYTGWRDLVSTNIARLTGEERRLLRQLDSDERIAERAARLGATLRTRVDLLGQTGSLRGPAQFHLAGNPADDKIATPPSGGT